MWKWIKRAICEKMCGSSETGSTRSSGTPSPPSHSTTNGDQLALVPIVLSTTGLGGSPRFLTGLATISASKQGPSAALIFTHSFNRRDLTSLVEPYGGRGLSGTDGLDLKLTIPGWVLTTTSPST